MPRVLMNYKELSQLYRTHGARKSCQVITEGLELGRQGKPGGLKSTDFSIRDLAEALVENGREWVANMDPRRGVSVLEAGDAIDSTAFSNITGQLLINEILNAYESEAFLMSQLFRTVPTRLSGEKIPGIGGIGDKASEVKEGMPFPSVGLGEDYIETPATAKDGLIVPVTKEAIFFDRTGVLLDNCSKVGEALGIKKEKECLDLFIGATNNYKWKGTSYDTYQATTPWINLLAGAANDLVDWTDIDSAEALFDDMLDPNTGEPVMIEAMSVIATTRRRHALNRVINATEIRYTASGAATETIAGNPIRNYATYTSRLLYRRLIAAGVSAANAATIWFLGDPSKAFAYMENWPITVVQAPTNSEAEFVQDIVMRYKASERGVAAVKDPRFMVKVTGHA